MLAPGHPDRPAQPDTCACCCAYPCVLHLMCPAPPLAFFEHAPPLATTTPHASSYYIAPTGESMCVGPPSYMREIEHSARTPIREREHNKRAPMWERPSCMRERGIIARVPQYARERESTARVPNAREGGSTAPMHMCWDGCMLHRAGPCLVV
jgi:hypothetical protein